MTLLCKAGHRHETDDPRNADKRVGDRCNVPSTFDPHKVAKLCPHVLVEGFKHLRIA